MISAAVAEQRQKQVQNEVDRSSARFDAAGDQVVDAEMPLEGQEVGVLGGQVVAEQVEDRRQREQREKADLRQDAIALQRRPAHSSGGPISGKRQTWPAIALISPYMPKRTSVEWMQVK